MNIGIFEDYGWRQLLPLTWLRPAYELRCGRERLIDKLRQRIDLPIHEIWVRDAIREVALERIELAKPAANADWCLINARLLLDSDVLLPPVGVGWLQHGSLLAIGLSRADAAALDVETLLDEQRLMQWAGGYELRPGPNGLRAIDHPWDLIHANPAELRRECTQGGAHLGEVHTAAHLVNGSEIYIGPGAKIKPGVVLDAENGPIHIDAGAQVQANAVIEGPCCIGRGSIVRAGASIRADTSIGPVCKVGGEIESSVIQGYSNKQHDGFLGHSFVAEWVNLGADTVTSDLKNTYGAIRASINGVPVETGHHFLGSIIGDHSKTGIGTILPTGCVIGIAANLFTHRYPPKFVPSFAWLTDAGLTQYHVEKAIRIARTVVARRDLHLSDAEARLIAQTAELAREVEAAGWAGRK